MCLWLFAVLFFLVPASAHADLPGGLQISAAADLVGTLDTKGSNPIRNRLDAREAEVMLYAPIDPTFDGVLSLAAHQEAGVANFEIHEMYVGSTKLIPRSRFRLGQFFLGFGRLNRFHRHDWPFTTAPTVITDFFQAQEGVLDSGAEYSYLLPTSFYLDFTAGITNGWVFGHAHTLGKKPALPTHYARLATYTGLGSGGAEAGLNYVGRKDEDGTRFSYLGLDLTAKWREEQRLKWLFQGEGWFRIKSPRDAAETEHALGFYLYPQYGFDASWSLGVRFDFLTILTLKNTSLQKVQNYDWQISPQLAYKASEFATFRATYNVRRADLSGVTTRAEEFIELQAVFILGTHPAHDF